jgi:hypothetical protein
MGMLDFILGKGPKEPDLSDVNSKNATIVNGLDGQVPTDYQGYDPHQLSSGDVSQSMVDGSAYDKISTDPRLRDAQMSALNKLGDVSQNGGMTLEDKANMNRMQTDAGMNDKNRRDAIMSGAAQRGNTDSGASIGAQLASSQAANAQESQAGMDIQGQAQKRALQSMQQQGQMAGQMQSQDFNQQAQQAAAKDRIAQYNSGVKYDAAKTNVAAQNAGAQYGATNHNNFQQNQFDNRYKTAGIKYNANTNEGNQRLGQYQSKVDAHQNDENNFVKTAAAAAGAGAAMYAAPAMASDENLKKDVKPVADVDIDAFLTSLNPKEFKYKDSKHGAGDRVGVMAQDVEKSPMGAKLVVNTGEGKHLDVNNVIGALLESVAHLHKTKANK